jgi:hypothetical protein
MRKQQQPDVPDAVAVCDAQPGHSCAGTHDTLRILLGADDPEDARTILVPFHKSIVPHIDAAARRMTIDPPDGLFDIAVPARRRHKNPRNKLPKL